MTDPFVGPTNTPAPVLPTDWQTQRQDIQAAITAMVNLFVASYANYIRKVWQERPQSATGEGPFIYIGRIIETITHDAGLRQTKFAGRIGYVDVLADPSETNTRINVFGDFMREVMTANARMLPAGIFQEEGFDDSPEFKQGASVYLTDVQIDWTFVVLEGRS